MTTQFVGMSLWSENLNNLLPFYRDTLGLKVTMESPEYVVFGGDTPASPWMGLGTHSNVRGRNAEPARQMVGLSTQDIDADVKRLKAAGVEFIEEPTQYEDIRIATLVDPEGNYVQLFEFRPNQ